MRASAAASGCRSRRICAAADSRPFRSSVAVIRPRQSRASRTHETSSRTCVCACVQAGQSLSERALPSPLVGEGDPRRRRGPGEGSPFPPAAEQVDSVTRHQLGPEGSDLTFPTRGEVSRAARGARHVVRPLTPASWWRSASRFARPQGLPGAAQSKTPGVAAGGSVDNVARRSGDQGQKFRWKRRLPLKMSVSRAV